MGRMPLTFGVERNETITERPVLHRLIENDFLLKRDHCDVFEQTQSLQNLLHRFRLGLFRHGTDTHHDLSLWGLKGPQYRNLKYIFLSILDLIKNDIKCNNFSKRTFYLQSLMQDFRNFSLESQCLAEFNSNRDQTYLIKLIKVFRITRTSPVLWVSLIRVEVLALQG